VDALQLVVALDKNFGLKVPDPAAAREILGSVNTIAAALLNRQTAS
jgi:acyl carrier protein